jgi:hypothetical protein
MNYNYLLWEWMKIMNKQNYFKDSSYCLSLLRRLANDETLIDYHKQNVDYDRNANLSLLHTTYNIPNLTNCEPSGDAENSINIYKYLNDLDLSFAAQPVLWTYLTHVTFRQYTQKRWRLPAIIPDDEKNLRKAKSLIAERWFYQGSKAMSHNALARLWWAAHLTVSPWNQDVKFKSLKDEDDFIYTRVIFSNQDMHTSLMEREVFQSKTLYFATLDLLRTHPELVSKEHIQDLSKELNLIAGFKKIEAMTFEDTQALVKRTAKELFERY